ncbi:tetratricopeptide (TPR) repeat protein [Micromonospora sp. A200]|uniref:XRE family transcriptional regulator n=1 Tax=Micromonospora sp. A200 TaxID=2940568 RepID=UPI0024756443|nr:XRE family transcriptional regulator [Micromonospora sp. A200]MDH6465805.1 tetratricopeptide (TPR) repeat protein [Micromonospora sp. A200]
MSQKVGGAAIPRHVLEREDMRAALAQHDFGTVFLLARKWAGISYSRIAEACAIKAERVGALARGQGSIATYEKISLIADAMRIPGHMLGLAPRDWEANQTATPDARGETVNRRDFLRVSAVGASTLLGAVDIADLSSGRRLGAELPKVLARRTARLRRLDDVLGGGDTLRLYLSEYETTKKLVAGGSYTDVVEQRLQAVLAEQAQQAGWAAFDAGKLDLSKQLYGESHRIANQAHAADLAGNALAFMAYQTVGGDPREAVAIAEASCAAAGTEAPATVTALLHERRAWAHAVMGNARETDAALATARAALERRNESQEPDWSTWVDDQEVTIMTGRCWAELGRPLRAVPLLEDVLEGFDDAHARDKALYSCWLADAYVTAGEPEEAARVAGRVLDLSEGVASVRPRQRLGPVLQRLGDQGAVPGVREVLERARA